jgi:phospholipase C
VAKKFPLFLAALAVGGLAPATSLADGNLQNVKHVIIIMQENHSFDNYFGVLPYTPNNPYHAASASCPATDHKCVDGLRCASSSGHLTCTNSNLDDDRSTVYAFHATSRCVRPDLDHSWYGTHREMNFNHPNAVLLLAASDGFVRQNDLTEQIDHGENTTDDQTISYYNHDDLPFYYSLAETFAISDRHFASVLGPTFPNRSYLMAATSFGHLTTNDSVPPVVGYKPITGTIFDLLDKNGISWADYFQDVPQSGSFRPPLDSHNQLLSVFLRQAAGIGSLPDVSFLDPNFGVTGHALENDEHPPTDIQRGQAYVSRVVNAVRRGPYWKDSIIFITYDEHGGFYDHARPPRALQGGTLNPDGINPGQCEDLSFPPFSEQPGGGAECSWNFTSTTDTTVKDAEKLCPMLSADPTGPYPTSCANFNQLGVRIPLIAVSPFSKPAYVSHDIGDHTSLLALIEKRFLGGQHLTRRDQYANTLEDMFDFDDSPSLNAPVGHAAPPVNDCTPLP